MCFSVEKIIKTANCMSSIVFNFYFIKVANNFAGNKNSLPFYLFAMRTPKIKTLFLAMLGRGISHLYKRKLRFSVREALASDTDDFRRRCLRRRMIPSNEQILKDQFAYNFFFNFYKIQFFIYLLRVT